MESKKVGKVQPTICALLPCACYEGECAKGGALQGRVSVSVYVREKARHGNQRAVARIACQSHGDLMVRLPAVLLGCVSILV